MVPALLLRTALAALSVMLVAPVPVCTMLAPALLRLATTMSSCPAWITGAALELEPVPAVLALLLFQVCCSLPWARTRRLPGVTTVAPWVESAPLLALRLIAAPPVWLLLRSRLLPCRVRLWVARFCPLAWVAPVALTTRLPEVASALETKRPLACMPAASREWLLLATLWALMVVSPSAAMVALPSTAPVFCSAPLICRLALPLA